MKNFYFRSAFVLFLLSFFINFSLFAQKGVSKWIEEIRKTSNFSEETFIKTSQDAPQSLALTQGTSLGIDQTKLSDLWANPRPTVMLSIPIADRQNIEVELARIEVTATDFKVSTSVSLIKTLKADEGIHYRGVVKGDAESLVAISIYKDDVRGFISDKMGRYEIGKINDKTGDYIIYEVKDLKAEQPFSCGSDSKTITKNEIIDTEKLETAALGVNCKTVSVFFECDYQMYLDNGSSVTKVTQFVTTMFNQVATLYQNENIDIQISQIYVWTTPDPYRSLTTTGRILQAYDVIRGSNFTGNFAQFLTTRDIGGGLAYINVLCNKAFAHSVCMVYNTFANYPTFSWTVNCVTHELGHNFGSNHTQWCGWVKPDGTTGPIDNCTTAEGNCLPGPAPVNGGTLMSYCHKTSYGINFANGFGTLPGDLIRLNVTKASCLISGASTAAAPTGEQTSAILSSGATLTWNVVPDVINYIVEYKASSSSNWIILGNFSSPNVTLTGLLSGKSYDWRVKCDCSGYSPTNSFLTTALCVVPTGLASASIVSDAATLAWTAVSGVTYTIQYRKSSTSTWTTVPNIATNSYRLTGLGASAAYFWQVKTNCSNYSAIAYFATIAAPCAAPTNLTNINVGSSTASLTWSAVSGATNYTIQYKKSTTATWTTAASVTTNSYSLIGLSTSTQYNWQVKASCSPYSSIANFTTTTTSCIAPIGLASSNIAATTASLTFTAVGGAANYTIQYKKSTTSTWTTAAIITTNSYSLTGLSASTTYNWQIKASCSGYSSTATFLTTASCAVPTGLVSASIVSDASTLAWTAVSGATYTIQYRKSSTSTWTIVTNVATNTYRLTGLSASTAYFWQVKTNCSNFSAIVYFATIAAPCVAPTNLSSINVASSSATIAWSAVSGATNYTIQYKKSTTATWTTAATITTNSYNLKSLAASTVYNWQIKASCSAYSSFATFSTLAKSALVTSSLTNLNAQKETISPLPSENAKFSIYPNPAQDNILLKISNDDEIGRESMYRIVDFRGNVRKQQNIKESSEKIDISDLERGTYIIQMLSKSGLVESKTLVKEQ